MRKFNQDEQQESYFLHDLVHLLQYAETDCLSKLDIRNCDTVKPYSKMKKNQEHQGFLQQQGRQQKHGCQPQIGTQASAAMTPATTETFGRSHNPPPPPLLVEHSNQEKRGIWGGGVGLEGPPSLVTNYFCGKSGKPL